MKYIIYCRKSTEGEDRQVLSLDAQERELRELAVKYNLEVVGAYRESKSALHTGRPITAQVIKEIKSGRADAILCWKLDRLSRNFKDSGEIIHYLQTSVIKEIRTYEAIHVPSDSVYQILFTLGQANQSSRDLSVNVRRGNREKLAKGGLPGVAPFGYLNDKADKTIVINKKTEPYVKRMFELYANQNKSYGEISDILFSEGLRTKTGRKVFKSMVQKVITSKFYMGIIEREGKLYQGIHESIVSKELFEKAQKVTSDKSRPRPSKLFFPFRGFLKCASCGCALTSSVKKGHHYYYCTNGKGDCEEHRSYLKEDDINLMLKEAFRKLAFDRRLVELVYLASKEKKDSLSNYNTSVIDKLQNDLKSLPLKESKLLDTFLEEKISKGLYDEKSLSIKNEKVLLQKEIRDLEAKKPSATLEPVRNVFMQGITTENQFDEATSQGKPEIISKVLWNLSIKDKKVLDIQYKSAYQLLANSPKKLSFSELLRRTCSEKLPSRPVRSFLIFLHYDLDALRAL